MRRNFGILRLALFCFLILPSIAFSQQTGVLSGQVTDDATGNPMPFANVYVNGSTKGAVTDERGTYTLSGIPLGTVEIVASFVGYQPSTQKIRFENATPQKANFRLNASPQMLNAVTVRGNAKRSERQLRQFKKQLFGEPFGSQCVLVNSDVLNFKEEKDHLYATASEPLLIDNQALGYRLIYHLQHFDSDGAGKVLFAGTARFEELKPENERQANQFRRNRLTAYKGSTRHLMATLIDSTFEEIGFKVYQEDPTKLVSSDLRAVTLEAAVKDFKKLIPVKVATLIRPGKLASERRLVSPMKLIVFYTKATSTFSPYPDARYAYTEIKLPGGQLQMTVDGVITIPEGMETKGSMGDDRLSTMLPADWKPNSTEKEQIADRPLATQGKLASPDATLEGISADFNKRFKMLAPSAFVHIDKPFYTTGDRLWLSTYLLDAATQKRTAGETAMQVDLLDPAGRLVQHQWVHISEGRGQGHFRLSDTLATGTYRLRAYTDEDDAQTAPAFERSVAVYNLLRDELSEKKDAGNQQPDVQILPEGGRWIAGLRARLGVKIVKPNGRGLAIEGRIVDDSGAEVTRFKTNAQGMTSITMQPDRQRSYYADFNFNDSNKQQRIVLPKTERDGLQLSADAITDSMRVMLTISASDKTAADSAYILIQQRGQVVSQQKVFLQNGIAKISLPSSNWPPGLAQITLYDAAARPQAERLVFIRESVEPVQVVLKTDKVQYQPREQVTLSVQLNDHGGPAQAALSASITDVTKVPEDSLEADIHTHLLLTGELRGHIENPDYYLSNRDVETRKALDDLLLTQGWRRVSGTPEADSLGGVSFRGRIVNAKKQPVAGAEVTVASTSPGYSFVKSVRADEDGRFKLAGLAVTDTVQWMTQLADKQSRKLSVKEAFLVQEQVGKSWEKAPKTMSPDWSTLQAQLDAARIRQEGNSGFYRDKTAKDLKEVTVRARKEEERPDDVKRRSLHDEADAVVIFDDKSAMYSNLYEMMQGRIAGLTVTKTVATSIGVPIPPGYLVYIRGLGSVNSGVTPLYLMDGLPIQDPDGNALLSFNPRDIERIEVLKNAGTAGIYGMRGGNGVVAFFTKTARSIQAGIKVRDLVTPVQFVGYPSVHREFYVPRYDSETSASGISGPVDDRDVLYWKPLIQTNAQGQTQLRFPLSDVVRTLRVVVQGITAEGRAVVGEQLIHVQ